MAETGGFGSVILPSTQPALGDVMMSGMDRQQRQFDRNANLLIHQRETAQAQAHRNQLYNLNQIGDSANEKQYQTGEQAVDAYSHNELQKIQDWLMQNAIDKDPAVATQMTRQKMEPFLAWHGNIKNALKQANVGLQEFNKTYPNADAVKAHNMVMDNIANE
jgi:nitric oxide reductase large subunit